jgi:hypothetical protein
MKDNLRMLFVDDPLFSDKAEKYFKKVEEETGIKTDIERSIGEVYALIEPRAYNVLIYDAIQDRALRESQKLSVSWKERNPDSLIIWTPSFSCGNWDASGIYDERIELPRLISDVNVLTNILAKHNLYTPKEVAQR